MTNEYDDELDLNGYAMSICGNGKCVICGATDTLVRHEIFHGPNRTKSKSLGLWVSLCPNCHMMLHSHPDIDYKLKRYGQRRAMKHYKWTTADFIRQFGKNYLEEIT